jgi:hypothetical protein
MAPQSNKHTASKDDSALSKFDIKFEYDLTWDEAKRNVQLRPIKNKK